MSFSLAFGFELQLLYFISRQLRTLQLSNRTM